MDAPKKCPGMFDSNMLQLFEFKRVLIDQTNPFDRDALQGHKMPIQFGGFRSRIRVTC